MNKKFILLLSILISVVIVGCQEKEDNSEIGKGRIMNIIDSNNNIKSIKLNGQAKTYKLQELIDMPIEEAIVMGQMGEVRYIYQGYFEEDKDSLNYISKEKGKIEDVVGVIIDPPNISITNAYYDMKSYLENERVLFILLDGFGYHQYEYAREKGFIPFLDNYDAIKALSVYKPVTNAGLAAIITGKTPEENGVYSRKQRELKVDSIFKVALELGKSIAYIEGNIGILTTEIEPVLNLDENKDGYTDDEVYSSTLKSIEDKKDFIFTHFHGIDDAGHTYGPLSDEAMERVKTIDSYIEYIVSLWDGIVIITADHGLHDTETGGDHGDFRYEDLIVPYIVINRGNKVG